MAALVLLRHTRPNIGPDVCYGQTDVDVQTSFEQEAREATGTLMPPDLIVTSPLQRCRKLAEFAAKTLSCDCIVDTRLTEMDFGRWETQSWSTIPRQELDAWAADFLHAAPHGGESVEALNHRVAGRLQDDKAANRSTLWVTHAGVIKSVRYLTAENPNEFDWRETVEFGQTTRIY
ncbi:MAG: histidine phosphatase family protein [Pseudomonadota bacterium]